MKETFTFKEYEYILTTIKNSGYRTVFFDEFKPEKNYQVLLRHDIDYDWLTTLIFSEIEHKLGLKSTHFFLYNGRYNLLSNELQNTIMKLRKLNHAVGLHYDKRSIIKVDYEEFENIIGKFNVISNHRPASNLYDNLNRNSNYLNTYDNKFAWEIKYYSDSNREWKYGYPLDKLDGNNFQLLIHPLWWNEKSIKNKDEAYIEFLRRLTRNWSIKFEKDDTLVK